MKARYAILMDGGFVTKRLSTLLGHYPTAAEVEDACSRIRQYPDDLGYELLRIYFYDAYPASKNIKRPISKTELNLADHEVARSARSLFDSLHLRPHFALRMGEASVSPNGWRIKDSTIKQLKLAPRALEDSDFVPNIGQKGVDMRVGMDMARLALRDLVRCVVVVTADTDFVPAFKFVRREGISVVLDTMGQSGSLELRQHADVIVDLARPSSGS